MMEITVFIYRGHRSTVWYGRGKGTQKITNYFYGIGRLCHFSLQRVMYNPIATLVEISCKI